MFLYIAWIFQEIIKRMHFKYNKIIVWNMVFYVLSPQKLHWYLLRERNIIKCSKKIIEHIRDCHIHKKKKKNWWNIGCGFTGSRISIPNSCFILQPLLLGLLILGCTDGALLRTSFPDFSQFCSSHELLVDPHWFVPASLHLSPAFGGSPDKVWLWPKRANSDNQLLVLNNLICWRD